jgi:hypothetical protein
MPFTVLVAGPVVLAPAHWLPKHCGDHAMSKLLRGLAAGYGAKKLGGGCISTVLIFLLLWWLLGHFGIFQ